MIFYRGTWHHGGKSKIHSWDDVHKGEGVRESSKENKTSCWVFKNFCIEKRFQASMLQDPLHFAIQVSTLEQPLESCFPDTEYRILLLDMCIFKLQYSHLRVSQFSSFNFQVSMTSTLFLSHHSSQHTCIRIPIGSASKPFMDSSRSPSVAQTECSRHSSTSHGIGQGIWWQWWRSYGTLSGCMRKCVVDAVGDTNEYRTCFIGSHDIRQKVKDMLPKFLGNWTNTSHEIKFEESTYRPQGSLPGNIYIYFYLYIYIYITESVNTTERHDLQ